MKFISNSFGVVLVMVLAIGAASACAQQASGTFERSLSMDGPVQLDIRTGAGSIVVRPGVTREVQIVGHIRVGRRFGRTAGAAQELVERLQAEPPIEVSGHRLRVGHIDDAELRRNVSISYEVDVPPGTSVTSRSGSGRVAITGAAGPVTARTGSGGVTLTDIDGSVNARTGSGSIRAEGIAGAFTARTGSGSVTLVQTAPGDVDVRTGSGSSALRGIDGAARVRAGSGRITIDGVPSAAWDIETGSGSIRLRLPADAGFDLEASTGSGRVRTEHPITLEGSIQRNRVNGTVRDGGPRLRLRTGSGGIHIE